MILRLSCLFLSLLLITCTPFITAQTPSIAINNPPLTLTSSTPFSVTITYTTNVPSQILVDVLLNNVYTKPTTGNIAVNPGTNVRVTVPLTWYTTETGNNYFYNIFIIDKNVWNANPDEAWKTPLAQARVDGVVINPADLIPVGQTPPPTPTNNPNPNPNPNPDPNPNPNPNPNPTPSQPTTDPSSTIFVAQEIIDGKRVCNVKASEDQLCMGCGYTVCRDSKPLFQTCPIGNCNPATNQCDPTILCRRSSTTINNNATSIYVSMTSVISIMVLIIAYLI